VESEIDEWIVSRMAERGAPTTSKKQTEHLRRVRCSWEGCWRTTAHPFADGWSNLCDWGPPVKDGFYCRAHADASEAVLLDGGFDPLVKDRAQ
jgi:hypothetical protein